MVPAPELRKDAESPERPIPSRDAFRIARSALALAVLGDVLLRAGPLGLNWTLWVLAICGGTLILGRRSGVFLRGSEAWPLALVAGSAVGMSWRDSGMLFLLYAGLALVGAALTVGQAGSGSALRRGPLGLLRGWVRGGLGVALAARHLVPPLWEARGSGVAGPRGTVVRGVLLAAVPLSMFAGLFALADPAFARLVDGGLGWIGDDIVSHVLVVSFLTWVLGGALSVLWLDDPHEAREEPRPPQAGGEVIVALGLVNVLFGAFLATQVRVLFGGRAYVEATLGLSYAEYARGGFFQLVVVACLVLLVLLLSEWVLRSGTPRERTRFRWMAGLLLVATGAVLVSALSRMRLYQMAYGLTEDRVLTMAFMGWLAFVFLWFTGTVLRGRSDRFLGGCVGSAVALTIGLTIAAPDARIAHYNATTLPAEASAERAAFDPHHAASLGADAVPTLVALVPRMEREGACVLARRLLDRWGSPDLPDWRTWNWSRFRARRVVREHATVLEGLRCPSGSGPRSG